MILNHKLPSFRLSIIEVVTAVVHAAAASHLVSKIFQLKKVSLLTVDIFCIISGWNNSLNTSINTAFSQPDTIGRMVYGNNFVTKHLQTFFDRNISCPKSMCNLI